MKLARDLNPHDSISLQIGHYSQRIRLPEKEIRFSQIFRSSQLFMRQNHLRCPPRSNLKTEPQGNGGRERGRKGADDKPVTADSFFF